jgi:hypothetical protein
MGEPHASGVRRSPEPVLAALRGALTRGPNLVPPGPRRATGETDPRVPRSDRACPRASEAAARSHGRPTGSASRAPEHAALSGASSCASATCATCSRAARPCQQPSSLRYWRARLSSSWWTARPATPIRHRAARTTRCAGGASTSPGAARLPFRQASPQPYHHGPGSGPTIAGHGEHRLCENGRRRAWAHPSIASGRRPQWPEGSRRTAQ